MDAYFALEYELRFYQVALYNTPAPHTRFEQDPILDAHVEVLCTLMQNTAFVIKHPRIWDDIEQFCTSIRGHPEIRDPWHHGEVGAKCLLAAVWSQNIQHQLVLGHHLRCHIDDMIVRAGLEAVRAAGGGVDRGSGQPQPSPPTAFHSAPPTVVSSEGTTQ